MPLSPHPLPPISLQNPPWEELAHLSWSSPVKRPAPQSQWGVRARDAPGRLSHGLNRAAPSAWIVISLARCGRRIGQAWA